MTESNHDNPATRVLFAYGFRPFFLLTGLYAVLSIVAWLWMYRHGVGPLASLPPHYWHGHEMIFGFIGAAIAGFLLTAVPNWTGSRGIAGTPLLIIVLLWFAGRLVFAFGHGAPAWLLTVGELGFVPALMMAIASPLLRAKNRNWPMLALLTAFWAADACFIFGMATGDPMLSRTAMLAALNVVLILITIIGGRIIPAFTGNALRAEGAPVALRSSHALERLVLLAMVAILLCDVFLPDSAVTAAVIAIASLLHFWRLAGWQGWRTAKQPIVWVLHLAYLWLPLGLGLKAASHGGGFAWAAHWLHALGVGAAAMMIVAVMTRASLGHTGRPLRVSGPITAAYGLLALAVIVRAFGPVMLPLSYAATVLVAGCLWIASFSLYLAVYAPILLRPRADGKPG